MVLVWYGGGASCFSLNLFVGVLDQSLFMFYLLAFDFKGYRVGYGKGFYDRFFASLPRETKKVGISLFEPCEAIEDVNEHDIPLTHCVTPNKIFTF